MLIDRREMSCVVSPAKVVKNVRKWIHMSKMLSIAFEREDVWSTKKLSDECKDWKWRDGRTEESRRHWHSSVSRLRWCCSQWVTCSSMTQGNALIVVELHHLIEGLGFLECRLEFEYLNMDHLSDRHASVHVHRGIGGENVHSWSGN